MTGVASNQETDFLVPTINQSMMLKGKQKAITNYQLPITNYQLPITKLIAFTNYQINCFHQLPNTARIYTISFWAHEKLGSVHL